jgi:FRG domain
MNGYWTGLYAGTSSGQIVVEVDDRKTHFEGCASTYDNDLTLPNTFAFVRTSDKQTPATIKAPLQPLHPQTGEPTDWGHIAQLYPGVTFPKEADVVCDWHHGNLAVSWTTDIGTSGSVILPRSQASQPSICQPLAINTWREFKEHVTSLDQYRYIFRGQTSTRRLRTPFYRTGRGDMRRFFAEDVPTLHRHLSALTTHIFNLSDPLQNAAFLNLAQHHGYPTPLLDWTYSPFVGAFFAFSRINRSDAKAQPDQKVRIFVFDKAQWCADFPQILNASNRHPHFSILEPIAIGNQRLIPQQALSTFATVDDIETYIGSLEEQRNRTYLQVIDLPLSERDLVLKELTMMGVTAGSLFPGLDGACEELKARFLTFDSETVLPPLLQSSNLTASLRHKKPKSSNSYIPRPTE